MAERLNPVSVLGLQTGVKSVAAGAGYSCAVLNTGGVKCWGSLEFNRPVSTPVAISGLAGNAIAVSTMSNIFAPFACVLLDTGGVQCWGANTTGQLGDGTTTNRATPAYVSGLSGGVKAIATGLTHACALLTSGAMKCWGANTDGVLGTGKSSFSSELRPVDVVGLTSGVAAIAVGYDHSCALLASGAVKCWGVRVGGFPPDMTPQDVASLSSGVAAISVGYQHSCAIMSAGGIKCWGRAASGFLGDGTFDDVWKLTPVNVLGISGSVKGTSAGTHTCVVTFTNAIKCWGLNGYGQLGDGSKTTRGTPVDLVFEPEAADYKQSIRVNQAGAINLAAGYELPFVLQQHTQGAHGVVSCGTSGACVYTPTLDYVGLDNFQYVASIGTLNALTSLGGASSGEATTVVTGTVELFVARHFVYLPLSSR